VTSFESYTRNLEEKAKFAFFFLEPPPPLRLDDVSSA
jgi:hypothetical protein